MTTHSPLVISSVDTASVRVLTEGGVKKPEFSGGLSAETVLKRVQKVDPTPDSDASRKVSRYLGMVERGEGHTNEARDLRREIERTVGGILEIRELADADAQMMYDSMAAEIQ